MYSIIYFSFDFPFNLDVCQLIIISRFSKGFRDALNEFRRRCNDSDQIDRWSTEFKKQKERLMKDIELAMLCYITTKYNQPYFL